MDVLLLFEGVSCTSRVVVPLARRTVLVRAAAAAAPVKKADQAAKRTRQNERRRVYNKAKKSEIHTRMKKVCLMMSLYNLALERLCGLCSATLHCYASSAIVS